MKQLTSAVLFLQIIIFLGTAGYVILEKWTILDAFYMTVISMTTTGFAEVHPLTPAGRLFTTGLIVVGVSTLAYIGGRSVQLLIESQLLRRRKLMKKIATLHDHYIVCGYGRLGRVICQELAEMQAPFVVIEKRPERVAQLLQQQYLFVEGDATHDDALLQAGIERAKGLVAVVATDADNVYVTLSAKVLKPDIFIVTRALEEETERKMLRAGANRIVKPYEIGATRMVHLLIRPGVADFIDIVANKKGTDLSLEEIVVRSVSPLVGKNLADSSIRRDMNVIIIAIYRSSGDFIYNPVSSTRIEALDRLIAIGQQEGLIKLNALCG